MSSDTALRVITEYGDRVAAAPAHGGRLGEARRRFPSAPEPFIDLSTGINPVPYPLPELAPEVFARLPDDGDLASLKVAAALAYNAHPDMIVAAPGTQILISLLPRLFPQRQVAVVGPTYSEHAAAWRAAGSEIVDTATIPRAPGFDAVVLCNPNNPDGRRHWPLDILQATQGLRERGLLVIDEAFVDLQDGTLSMIPHLPQRGVIVLRSFGKSYGLGGVRLGFAVTSPETAAIIAAALGPWAVSGPAIAAGRAALPDFKWRDATRRRLDRDVARLDHLLKTAGGAIVGGTRLFRLARFRDASALFEQLGRAGILARPFELQPDWLRFGLPANEEAWKRLGAALA